MARSCAAQVFLSQLSPVKIHEDCQHHDRLIVITAIAVVTIVTANFIQQYICSDRHSPSN